VLLISGSLSLREDEDPKVIADKIMLLQPDCERLPEAMRISRQRKAGNRQYNNGRRNNACPTPPALPERQADPVMHADRQKDSSADHNMSLVIRCTETPSDEFIDAVRATCSYFSGSMPVYIFDEKEGRIVDWITLPPVASDSETIAIFCRRFGSANLCLI
ncbi:MAG: hypothetical protein GX763_07750, partial [Clostridiaceae bacterium]|nr:hypothetical protein [Clostridiaceae bacterium]